MAKNIEFVPGSIVYRNTWMNEHGNIRTQLYHTREKAELVAKRVGTIGGRFQEIGTPVESALCLINPEYF